jgi:hypothetical protein
MMTITTVELLAALAELIRQGGLLALVVIEGWIIYKLYNSRDELYDRLIESTQANATAANAMTARVTEALTRSATVAERIEQRKYGLLTEDAGREELEDEDEALAEDEEF